MIRRRILLGTTAVAMTAALAACGGNKNSSSSTPTPTPTATASPTPTPATYSAFPLAAAAEFGTYNSEISYTGDATVGPVTLGPVVTDPASTRVRFAVGAATASDTWVAHENTEESRYTGTNLTTAPDPSVSEYVFSTTGTGGAFAQTEFLNNTIKDKVTSDTGLNLTTVSYANWYRGDSTTGQKRLTYSVFGYPTVSTDMPTTGTASYASRVVGRTVSVAPAGTAVITRVAGTITVNVNYATGLVTATLALTTTVGGVTTPYTTLTATGAIPVGTSSFSGSFSGPLSGTFAGNFFGAQGKEIGFSFGAGGTLGGNDTRLVGVLVGKKNAS